MTTTTRPVSVDDFLAIARLANAYANAVVDRDADAWGACWDESGEWDLGGGRGVTGRDAIVAFWSGAMAAFAKVVQTVHNGDAWQDADPDTAAGRWNISERYRLADGTTGLLLAHYDDEYRRVGGTWLFAKRKLVAHYQGPADLSGNFL